MSIVENKENGRASIQAHIGTQVIGIILTAGIGALVGWIIKGLVGALIGIGLGTGCGWIVSDSIFWMNDGQVIRIIRGVFIGFIIFGVLIIVEPVFGGQVSSIIDPIVPVILFAGGFWGAVVFSDLKAALKWAAIGATLGPVASIPMGISIARMGTESASKLLTAKGLVTLVGLMTIASAFAIITGRLFVGNLLTYGLISGLGLKKKKQ